MSGYCLEDNNDLVDAMVTAWKFFPASHHREMGLVVNLLFDSEDVYQCVSRLYLNSQRPEELCIGPSCWIIPEVLSVEDLKSGLLGRKGVVGNKLTVIDPYKYSRSVVTKEFQQQARRILRYLDFRMIDGLKAHMEARK